MERLSAWSDVAIGGYGAASCRSHIAISRTITRFVEQTTSGLSGRYARIQAQQDRDCARLPKQTRKIQVQHRTRINTGNSANHHSPVLCCKSCSLSPLSAIPSIFLLITPMVSSISCCRLAILGSFETARVWPFGTSAGAAGALARASAGFKPGSALCAASTPISSVQRV